MANAPSVNVLADSSSASSAIAPPAPASEAAPSQLEEQLRDWMAQCRTGTLALFDSLGDETYRCHAHPDFSPAGWHLGHIAYTEALWLLEHSAQLAPLFPEYRRLFAADGLPKTERVNLPPLAVVQDYLTAVRQAVFDYLPRAPLPAEERLWRWLLQHESQHDETIALVLQLQRGLPAAERMAAINAQFPDAIAGGDRSQGETEMVKIPAGECEIGSSCLDAQDNERPAHRLHLDAYWIDRTPVTSSQYQRFIAAGGYRDRRWWSDAGWQWLQTQAFEQPLYWSADPLWQHHPVCGVSWYEADAYARFVGKRLPTEAEWENAARWQTVPHQLAATPWDTSHPLTARQFCNCDGHIGDTTPVGAFPQSRSDVGCDDLLGNVWEWTASCFQSYANFVPYPYSGYSRVYFDGQHRVLRGGSWATRPWGLRSSFRNWYYPHIRQIFAGFRCALSAEA